MDYFVLRVVLFFTILCVAFTNKTKSGTLGFRDSRHVLMSQLTENYDTRIPPVVNRSHAVDVQYEMSLNQIIELYWKDDFLTWDPADFDGINIVHLSVDSIWRPDVVLYNSVDVERTAFEVFPAGVAGVTHEGAISWLAPVIMQSLCKIKVDAYPFDEQTCPLKFGSWSYDGSKLNFSAKSDKVLLQNYVTSVEWQVLDTPCKTNVIYYDCCPAPYPDVTCYLVIRRRPAFYLFNLVLPTVLLLIIGLLVFCLPPESGEKVSLAITVLLSMSVLLSIVMDNVPANAEAIPLLELFIGGTVGMLTLSTAMAVFVVNFHFRGSYSRPPYWVRCCCMGSFLTTICCLRKEVKYIEDEDEVPVTSNSSSNSYTIQNGGGGVSLMSMSSFDRTGRQNNNSSPTPVNQIKIHSTDRGTGDATQHTLQQILDEVRHQSQRMHDRYREKKADSLGEAEWRVVAMTVDRIFFVILTTISLVMSLVIFKDVL